jgi:RNA polymerase sigma-70 factor (ECF subfamily)
MLLERHRAPLYARALRVLGNAPQAQDAVQDAFLVALSTVDRLREPDAVGGWLRGILRNVCLTRLREGRRQVLFDELPRRVEAGLSEPPPEEAIDRLAMREWVWTALGELPEDLRVTAMLRYFGSYASYEEISAILGVPVGTVRSRLSRVKVRLADALLKTAGLAHDEARRLSESEARFFAAACDELHRGYCGMFADAFSEDLTWFRPEGTVYCGRDIMVYAFESDLEDGVKLHLTNVVAGKDITIIEGDFENPSENPFHCPPATSMVCFYGDGKIRRMRQYFAPRASSDEEGR